MKLQNRIFVNYAGACLAVGAGFIVRLILVHWAGPGLPTYITFYPVVMFVALLIGMWPGIFATIIIALSVDYFLLPPQGMFKYQFLSDAIGQALFTLMGLFMCIVAGLYRRIRNRLEERVAERTRELTSANAMLRQYVELIDHAGDALIVRDMQGTIIFWNRGATSLYGWTVTEAMGMSIHTLLKTKGLPTDINDFLEQNKHWEGELLQQTRGGRIVTVEARKTCVIAGEGRALVLESLRDITERKQAEDALHKSSDDLARSNKDLEQFAYVASHDLQEPLRAVGGFMGLLKRQNQDSLNAEALEFINFAIEGAERMQALIQDLLAFSRVGAKGNVFTDVSLEEAFANALKNLHSPVEETNAIVTHDTLPIVKADLPQMIQLFQNLLQNAIKFHGLRRPEVHVTALQKDNDWVIGMRDNGIGIERQYFERIFLIFQRLYTRSQYSGTGIGLSVCKKIVERHGGSIWVESTPGVGSTFYFSIPKVAGFAEKGVLS